MKKSNRFLVLSLILLAALLLSLPVTTQATPSIGVTKTPVNQTVRSGDPATFTITVTNNGDTNLTSIKVTDYGTPECNGELSGLMQGDTISWTCSRAKETEIFGNNVTVIGFSLIDGETVMYNYSAKVTVMPPPRGDFIEYFPNDLERLVVNFTKFFTESPASWFWNFGTSNTYPVEGSTNTYPDGSNSTAPLMVPNARETNTETLSNYPNITREHGPAADFAIHSMTQTDVFTRGEDGYYFYLDPAIESMPDGSLIAIAEAWKFNETDPEFRTLEISLVYKRSFDNGVTWSPMIILEDPGELWISMNPATVVDRFTGRLWIFYIHHRSGRDIDNSRPGTDDMQLLVRSSDDNGRTWSEPRDLTAVARDMNDPTWRASMPGPGGAIQTSRGRLLVPMWKAPYADFAIFSDDHGLTWQRGQFVPNNQGGCENQLVELADGRILMDIRQIEGPYRWMTESNDGGETWSEAWPGLNVTTVRCAMERFTLQADGEERNSILWTGPNGIPGMEPADINPFARWGLTIRVSYDEGKTFANGQLILDQAASYSDLTILKDGTVGILWERGLQTPDEFITFTRFNLILEPQPE